MRKIREILRLKYLLKLTHREISHSLNISAGTVGEYISLAKVAGIASWPLPEAMDEEALYEVLYRPVKDKKAFRPRPDYDHIHQELRRKGVTLLLLWREYRDQHPNGLGYTRFCCGYNKYAKTLSPVLRQVVKGSEGV